jgi:hypothetical protein
MKKPQGTNGIERAVIAPILQEERRESQRNKVSRPLRLRPSDPKCEEEVRATLNASRDGLYFRTWAEHYHIGMALHVTFPYASVEICNSEYAGEVLRIEQLEDGSWGIAIRIRSL